MSINALIGRAYFLLGLLVCLARNVLVDGYNRCDGTYARLHIRSAPNSTRSSNYGRSMGGSDLMNPRAPDYDYYGTPNYHDFDDDNDLIQDDSDRSRYGR